MNKPDFKRIYADQFSRPDYAMGRIETSRGWEEAPDHAYALGRLPAEGPLFDIGTGSGTFVKKALARFPGLRVHTSDLDNYHGMSLPFMELDLTKEEDLQRLAARNEPFVTCIGVLEHLPEEFVPAAVRAIASATAGRAVVVTANHVDKGVDGADLHLTFRPGPWWKALFAQYFEVLDEHEYSGGRGHCLYLERKDQG